MTDQTGSLITRLRTGAADLLDEAGKRVKRGANRIRPKPEPPSSIELRERWNEWLTRAHDDVLVLHDYQATWHELARIVDANDGIPTPNHVMDFTLELYGIAIAVGIRRQADKSNDVANLRRLITDIARHPHALSRAWYVSLGPQSQQASAHRVFDGFAGEGGATVDPNIIRQDLAKLGSVAAKIGGHVNKRIAHAAEMPYEATVTFGDLRSGLDVLDSLLQRYFLLVDGRSLTSSTPTKQYDFGNSLTVAWIPSSESRQSP